MIDLWEALGRLLTDQELNARFEKTLPPAGEFKAVAAVNPLGQATTGLDIPEHLYERVQVFLGPVLGEQYLTVMSAGELIWIYSYADVRQAIRKLGDIMSRKEPRLSNPPPGYFIALGAIMVDKRFSHKVQTGEHHGLQGFHRLSEEQVERLGQIAGSKEFGDFALIYRPIWNTACFSLAMPAHDNLYTLPSARASAHEKLAAAAAAAGAGGY